MKKLVSVLIITALLVTAFVLPANATTAPMGTLGDVDRSGKIDVLDATKIQNMLSKLCSYDAEDELYADVDLDRKVSIIDATNIQLYIGKLLTNSSIGRWYNYDMYTDDFYYDYLSGTAVAGVPVTFTANVRAGSPIQNYKLYVNDELVAVSETSNSLTYTFPQAGTYQIRMWANAFYNSGIFGIKDYVVVDSPDDELKFKALYSTGKYWGSFIWGKKDMKFYAEGMGGVAPYQYEFTFERPEKAGYADSPTVTIVQPYSDQNYFDLPAYRTEDIFGEPYYGSILVCKLTIRIKDANGDVVEQQKTFNYEEHMIG